MNKKIGLLGGDLRIIRLAEILAKEKNNIYTYALEKNDFRNDKIIECSNLKEFCSNCNVVVSGIPFSKDGIFVSSPMSDEHIKIEELFEQLKNRILIAGAVNLKNRELAKNNDIELIDLMENEQLTIMNVFPTVEGAIQIAMENTEETIHGSNCLVLGYGRIGKLLCKTLKSLGANVACMARKEKDLAWIRLLGYKDIYLKDLCSSLKNKYNIIFNTVPSILLNEEELQILKQTNQNCIIIELASSPGGIDLKKAEEYNIKVIYAQGLPGKVAPYTAAKYIKETIEKL